MIDFSQLSTGRKLVFEILGGLRLCKHLTSSIPKILLYHRFSEITAAGRVSANMLEKQIIILKNHFNIISLDELVSYLNSENKPPKNSVCITVDDGYSDFYLYAYPVFRKYDIPVTIFLSLNFITGKDWLWPDKIRYILDFAQPGSRKFQYNGLDLDLKSIDTSWSTIANFCLHLDNTSKDNLIYKLSHDLSVTLPEAPVDKYMPLNIDQIKEMLDHNITIGSHTLSHSVLANISQEEAHDEIFKSRKLMEEIFDCSVKYFSYPNGTVADVNLNIINIVSKYYDAAFSAIKGRSVSNKYFLPRHCIDSNLFEYKKSINGYYCI